MPRAKLRSKVLSAPDRSRAIIASAANFEKGRPSLPITGQTTTTSSKIGGDTSWQGDCWTYYDSIGEYWYSVNWVGNLLSRAVLYVTKDGEKTTDKNAVELLEQLFDGPDGQADMMRQLGIHFTVAGDCYLIGVNAGDDTKDDWLIGAANATSKSDEGVWKVADETFTGVGKPLVIRLWQPHPTNRMNSTSPSRAALTVLSELDGLTKKNAADIDSRLSGAGMLLIPNEISFGSPTVHEDEDGEPAAEATSQPDELVRALIEVSSLALADQSTAAAKVPIVLQGPGENLNQIKLIDFSTKLDERAESMRTEAIRRLALSMDMPPEILTGTSDMNHWSSWQLEEAAIKAHTEPLLQVICSALTEGYLRPMLDGKDAESYAIAADTAALRLRPNRSEEAIELYDRGILTPEATLRENGFDPDDLMNPEAVAQWLLKKTAQGSTTPEIVEAALRAMQVPIGEVAPPPGTTNGTPKAVDPERPLPSLKGHPTQDIPDPAQSESGQIAASADPHEEAEAALTAAAGVMVYRALERAGNKIKSRLGGRLPGVKAADLYRHVAMDFSQAPLDMLLDDAWSTVDEFAPRFQVDRKWLAHTLDVYTRDLIQSRKPFDYQTLRAHLSFNALPDPARVIDRG